MIGERGFRFLSSALIGSRKLHVGIPRETLIPLDYSTPPPHLAIRPELPPEEMDEDKPPVTATVQPDITD